MKKSAILLVAGSLFVASCSTNPYTGESEVSKTGLGAGLGAIAGSIGGAIVGGRHSVLMARASVLSWAAASVFIWINRKLLCASGWEIVVSA